MEWQKFAGWRGVSAITVAAGFALAAATACSGAAKFSSAGGTGGAAAGSGGSSAGSGGASGAPAGGAGGTAGAAAAGGAAGSGSGGAAGAPTSTCGPCDGCCVGSSCVSASQLSWSQCGAHGAACTTCAYGVTCDSGTCTDTLDPDALFQIVVDSVQVKPTNAAGAGWDLGSLPDPMVCFDDGQGTNGCTNYCSDQTSCTYPGTDGSVTSSGAPVNFSGASLSHVTMVVYDYDPTTSNDKIGSKTLQLQSYSAQYNESAFDQVISVAFHLVAAP